MEIARQLLVSLSVTGSHEWITNIDIDNLSKSVLDGLKGIVFDDDKNVYCSFAEKREAIDKNGLCVGIKMIKSEADYFDRYFPRCLVDDKIVESKDVWWLKFDDSKNPEIPS